MYKIAVLGDYDSIYGFAALGLDTYPVKNPEEAKETFLRLAEEKAGIIYITEACAAVSDLLEAYGARVCVYGHLHGAALSGAFRGERNGVAYYQASCDGLGFKLLRIPLDEE